MTELSYDDINLIYHVCNNTLYPEDKKHYRLEDVHALMKKIDKIWDEKEEFFKKEV
jgi:hypothetical protein